MKRALLALALLAPAAALARDLPAPVREALSFARIPHEAVGVFVEPVEGGRPLVAQNATKPLNPASVMKLVTTYAGLDLLGPAFAFRTEVLAAGELASGALAGDLVIKGGGDPKLGYERMWQLAHQLRALGLREIRGDVVLDRGYFAAAPHDPGRFDGETRRAYNVGPDALLVNYKAVTFRFVPEGTGVKVTAEPDLPNLAILSRLRLVAEPCGAWRRGLKYDIEERGLLATATFSGTYPAECGENTWPLSVFDADRYAESVFRWVWSEAGGTLAGKVRAGTAPPDAKLLYRHESEPLASLVRDINKFSNNVMARQLFLALSAEKAAVPGEAKASERVVREWLKAKGIDAPEFSLENGSGLSRSDRASAATIVAVLRSAWASPVMSELMSSLPVFAVDGTLKSRNGGGATGQAHLKGGTLTGAQSVAGYVLDARGRRWALAMIVNGEHANRAQPAFDALVDWVYRQPR